MWVMKYIWVTAFLFILSCSLACARCDKDFRSYSGKLVNKKTIVISSIFDNNQIDLPPRYTPIRTEILTSDQLFSSNKDFFHPHIIYKFAHGSQIEYGFSVKRHALRLKFKITEGHK